MSPAPKIEGDQPESKSVSSNFLIKTRSFTSYPVN